MSAVALALTTILAATDPCAPIVPAGRPDPALAQVYLEVAQTELRGGHTEAAVAAFRAALSHAPGEPRASAALDLMCRRSSLGADLEQAQALLRERRFEAAGRAFERVLELGENTSTALLAGIAWYEAGEDARAAARLEQARTDPQLRESASLLLGLVRLREGRPREAVPLFDASAAARDPTTASSGVVLRRQARREGHLVAQLAADAEYNSNVLLVPEGAALAEGPADGAAAAGASLIYRPLLPGGPFTRVFGQLHKQARYVEFDFSQFGGSLGWRTANPARWLALEYDLTGATLGGQLWSLEHRATLEGSWRAGPVSLFGALNGGHEAFLQPAFESFSGVRYGGIAGAELRVGAFSVAVSATLARQLAQLGPLSFVEPGVQINFALLAGPRTRLSLEGGVSSRSHDALDPLLMQVRHDAFMHLGGGASYALNDWLDLRATLSARRGDSSVPSLSFTRVQGGVGLSGTAAVF